MLFRTRKFRRFGAAAIPYVIRSTMSVTIKWFAVKTASEMTYTVSGGALNSTQSNPYAVRSALLATARLLVLFPHARPQDRSPPLKAHDSSQLKLRSLYCLNYNLKIFSPPPKKKSKNCSALLPMETVNGYNSSIVKDKRRMFAAIWGRAT